MPEYLAPGVFVEETSFRQKTIEGVSTSTTGFVGPTRFGPVAGEPELLTSFSDYERIYGGIDQISFEDLSGATTNFMAQAARAYFEEGGRRLYVARIFEQAETGDGIARMVDDATPEAYRLEARHPGAAGNMLVTFVFRRGDNAYALDPVDPADPEGPSFPVLRGIAVNDTVIARSSVDSPATRAIYWVDQYFDDTLNRLRVRLRPATPGAAAVELDTVDDVRRVTVSIIADPPGRFLPDQTWEELAFHPGHPRALARIFAPEQVNDDRATTLFVPLVFETDLENGAQIAEALTGTTSLTGLDSVLSALTSDAETSDAQRSFRVRLSGGNDGNQPDPGEYAGRAADTGGHATGLTAFEDIDDISIVAAPGSSFDYSDMTGQNHAQATARRLISHCERMRYRIAVLDSVNNNILSEVRDYRGSFDTTRAALYYPWVRIFDPLTEQQILVPPSGHVAGIYARNDVERGVHKAPANEVLRLAEGFEFAVNTAQQEVLNPRGINCLRFFEGRGYRVWGARTATSDPEWKYVNVRRYFAFLERSIERGTQSFVFENNGEVLWANVRRTVEDFLFNEWSQRHLMGTKPEEAYFVRCDRSTMTQNDIDNGRLICLIGVAPLRPAEFVIFRIGQKLAQSR